MQSIKKILPDELSLHARLDEVWGDLTHQLHEKTYGERTEMNKYRRPLIVSSIIAGIFFIAIWLGSGGISTYIGIGVSFILAMYYGYYWLEARKLYTKKLNKLLYETVFKFFGLEATHFAGRDHPESVKKQNQVLWSLSLSELLTERKDNTNIGDIFCNNLHRK